MNISDLAFGELEAFDAVRRTRSVSLAAAELGVAQPTLSNRLRRLRGALGDPLFVRTAQGMIPTPFADELGGYVTEALALLEKGLRQRHRFDPAREKRTFSIIMTDIAESVILPILLERAARLAPGLRFRTRRLSMEDTLAALQSGDIDLAIGFIPQLTKGIYQQLLFTTDYVCIASAEHPRIGSQISRAEFLSARHAVADASGTGHYVVEAALDREGIGQQIDVRVPSFLALPFIVSASEMIATVPRPLDRIMHRATNIKRLDHPLDLPRIEIKQFWHERFSEDPANRWLRALLRDAFATVDWGE